MNLDEELEFERKSSDLKILFLGTAVKSRDILDEEDLYGLNEAQIKIYLNFAEKIAEERKVYNEYIKEIDFKAVIDMYPRLEKYVSLSVKQTVRYIQSNEK
ncbi:hypothetical protein [Candidatus Sulfurimonas baltica]|uniref:Uncharacterized protein n=1 Tax=Candidatus Sulfurimonas baltica TaxID=2740404 RepID=A0A7S7LXD0_9BACT|nr:hypothetical protein [Candidatus Sulfurimonas baltica]QOY53213.1 hypothetical protein HUE88_05915 [Candidatus Sulfurimonas baltica]